MRRLTVAVLVLLTLSLTVSLLHAADAETVTVLKGARIIDGTGNAPIDSGVIVIKGTQIAAVGPVAKVKIPKGARVVDVTGRTIMPGMISAHSHLGLVLEGKNRDDAYTRDNVMKSLNQYEQYGVTGIISMVSIAI